MVTILRLLLFARILTAKIIAYLYSIMLTNYAKNASVAAP